MRVIHRERVREFVEVHPDAKSSLCAWIQNVESNSFRHFAHLREMFGSCDYVKPHTVFNISGNKYRLIAVVSYTLGAISVEAVLSHAEYDKEKWRS